MRPSGGPHAQKMTIQVCHELHARQSAQLLCHIFGMQRTLPAPRTRMGAHAHPLPHTHTTMGCSTSGRPTAHAHMGAGQAQPTTHAQGCKPDTTHNTLKCSPHHR